MNETQRGLSIVFMLLGGMVLLFPNSPADRMAGGVMLICGVWLFVAVMLGRR